jgi:carboxymethylenebutenolidase
VPEAIRTASIRITGAYADEIEAYQARPDESGRRGGVVLIHHMPGFDRWSKEVARRFAVDGYDVLMPNLFWRDAPGADPDDAAAASRASGGVPDDRLVGDVAGAAAYLRGLGTSNGKVGVIGHCSGGRQSVLAACNVDVDAAVDCYGAFVLGVAPAEFPLPLKGLEDQLADLRCPLLGLFGNDDRFPGPDEVTELGQRLTELGKEYEFHRYDGAAHAFFAADRPSYRVEAALDGYRRIAAFYRRTLS